MTKQKAPCFFLATLILSAMISFNAVSSVPREGRPFREICRRFPYGRYGLYFCVSWRPVISWFLRRRGDRHRIHLVSVLVHDADEPTVPVPARHDLAVFQVARQHQGLFPRRGIARKVQAFVIRQHLLSVGEMKIIASH